MAVGQVTDMTNKWSVTVAPPVLHVSALNRMVSDVMENSMRRNGPMQHLAVLGPWGSGKSFLVASMENRLVFDGFRGQVVRLPEFAGHLQSPRDFIAEVYAKVDGQPPDAEWGWEAITALLDKRFTARSQKRRLLVVVAENFPELVKRAFPAHADQAKLRNWLDRSESRVMLIATSAAPAVDAEPGDPLFGIFDTVRLDPVRLDDAERLLAGYAAGGGYRKPDTMFRFLYLLGDRTPRSVELLAHSYLRYLRQDWRAIIEDYRRVNGSAYQTILSDLGQRAAVCLHAMLRDKEPVTQSGLAEKMKVQQSRIAQPFAEMRRKNLLREEQSPNGRSKLVSVADRFFASFYRERVLGLPSDRDPIHLLAELLDRAPSPEVTDLVSAIASTLEGNGRAAAFKTFLDGRSKAGDGYYWRQLAIELATRIISPELLRDIVPVVQANDTFSGNLLGEFAGKYPKGRLANMPPELRAFFEAIS